MHRYNIAFMVPSLPPQLHMNHHLQCALLKLQAMTGVMKDWGTRLSNIQLCMSHRSSQPAYLVKDL